MLQILLAIRLYLSQRGILARIHVIEEDIDDDIDWMMYDTETVAIHEQNNYFSLIAQYKNTKTALDFAESFEESTETQNILLATKSYCKNVRSPVMAYHGKSVARFDIRDAESLQKIYEFITSRS